MFIEILFFTFVYLCFNWRATANFSILVCFFLKRCLFFPNISILSSKIERSFIFFDKLGFILFILSIFSIIIIFLRNYSFNSIFNFLNKRLLASLIFVFLSSNLLLFYFFFEITIIPTIIIIIIWGYQPERLQASFYFFFYTILASLPLLVFILFVFRKNKTNSLTIVSNFFPSQIWWIVAIIAFLIKFPMFFFHLWLPKAHVEAPLGGSMILAAVLLKLGGIGIFRIITLLKYFTLSSIISSVRIWGRILTVIICLQQSDIKAIIAYSSVAHIRFLISGIFLGREAGINGRVLIMFFHGISSAALFIIAKILYEFTNSRSLVITKGKINLFPRFSLFWALLITINIGVPPARRFWAEVFLIIGLTYKNFIFGPLFFILAFFSTVYSCFLIIRIHHGKLSAKINPFQCFYKSNFCPIFIFSFLAFGLFLSPSLFFIF